MTRTFPNSLRASASPTLFGNLIGIFFIAIFIIFSNLNIAFTLGRLILGLIAAVFTSGIIAVPLSIGLWLFIFPAYSILLIHGINTYFTALALGVIAIGVSLLAFSDFKPEFAFMLASFFLPASVAMHFTYQKRSRSNNSFKPRPFRGHDGVR